ncbi:MFS transporter [Izhakiella australiensis]|uniref:MFS transporter n=1 Tax=Izhakiella australiensis TaxID=1926881 RepID=A0A1S8YNY5_9GAMM|nr:MFS transporter [Izhakiella australiensis]OON40353.1 MFS transporter [Izhakiella australiensis]
MNLRESALSAPLTERASASEMRKVAAASAVGTLIEYYDFTLYTTATALVFNKIFFPGESALIGSLAAFATYFVGYCARPLGGIVFGHFGDRIGRKVTLMTTLMIMGIGTFLIGLIPPYAQIGAWAPVLLVLLRCLQGIGIGGEYGGGMTMMVEHAPASRRGFYSSLVHIGVPAGFLLPIMAMTILNVVLDQQAFLSWGWRLPFLLSLILLGVGLFIRNQIAESPAFRRLKQSGQQAKVPVAEAVRNHWRTILLGIGAKIAESGLFNIYAVFAISYCVNVLSLPSQVILYAVLLGCLLECFTLPLFGWLSDKIGQRRVYLGGMLLQALLAWPFMLMLQTGQLGWIYLAISLGLALGHGTTYGAQGALFSALFPSRIRYSGLSLVQQIGPILGGGLSPMVATALLVGWHNSTLVIGYMIAMSLLSALCAWRLPQRPVEE